MEVPIYSRENGGGVFVLFYLLFLVIMGIPVMTMEYAIGRASRQSLMKGYKKLEKPGSKWHIHGWFAIMGSYMSEEKTLTGEAVKVCILDTLVAVMAGMIIFPACFSYNIKADQGPSLIFITLPTVFMNMQGGRVWGTLFFILMTFASFSTVTAVFENLVAFMMDDLGMSRRKSVFINMIIILIMSMPCVLGYNVLGDLRIMGDKNVLDFEDFIVSSILLPVGSLIITLFCVSESGWGMDNYIKEVNSGEGIKISTGLERCIQYALPVLILIVLIEGLV